MPRSIWNGMISFGLVNIPVGLYPATRDNDVHFHLLHKKDCGRIRQQRVCEECGEVVDYDELVKGYEYEKGEYIGVTPQELEKAQPETSELITIHGFVNPEKIDPIYYERPYYLMPDRKSDRVYTLLREALKQSNRVGIATFVLRSKEYLAALRPCGNALILDTLHFADEIREAEGMPKEKVDIKAEELKMTQQLMDAMEQPTFDAAKFPDTYAQAVQKMIEQKLAGKKIGAGKTAPRQATNVLDLMSRLKASLEETGQSEKEAPAKKTKPAAKRAPRKTTRKKSTPEEKQALKKAA